VIAHLADIEAKFLSPDVNTADFDKIFLKYGKSLEGEEGILSPEDRMIFDLLEKAQEQYRDYLATSEIGSLAKLTTRRSDDQPPRTDLPLTLTVS
jgi:hypothetical protein